jgi:hypothetical protein
MGMNYTSLLTIIASLAEGKSRAVNNQLPDSVYLPVKYQQVLSPLHGNCQLQHLNQKRRKRGPTTFIMWPAI